MKREVVVFETSMGNFHVELRRNRSPVTVENFLGYVKRGFYDGSAFHRVKPNWVAQGGGYTSKGKPIAGERAPPIPLESNLGLRNQKYTIAVPRDAEPDTGREQFFFNLAHNGRKLDYANPSKPGYAVFGRVIQGRKILDRIGRVPTAPNLKLAKDANDPEHKHWPVKPIEIFRVYLKPR